MGLLEQDKAVFYHPLDNQVEHIDGQTWAKASGYFGDAKVGKGLFREDIGASVSGLSAGYASAAGATRVAFCAWLGAPSGSPPQTAAPAVSAPIDDGATSVSGTSSEADGTAIQVYKDGIAHGTTTTVASGAWTQSGMSLAAGDVVKAKARAPGKLWSAFSGEVAVRGYGEEKDILTSDAIRISAAFLSADKFVVAYTNVDNDNHGAVKVGEIDGTDVSLGDEVEFLSVTEAWYIAVTGLSADAFVVAYHDRADDGHGTVRIGTVSGTSVTFGAESEFLSADSADYISVAALSSGKFVVAYSDGSDGAYGKAKVGTVAGGTATFGDAYVFRGRNVAHVSAAALSSGKFVVAFRDNSLSGDGAIIGEVVGTVITFGPTEEFVSSTINLSVSALSDSSFVIAYRESADSDHGTVRIGAVADRVISFGDETEFNSTVDGVNYVFVAALSSSTFVVACRNDSDSGHGEAFVGTVSGGVATFGEEMEFYSAGAATYVSVTTPYASVAALSSGKFVVAFRGSRAEDDRAKVKVRQT